MAKLVDAMDLKSIVERRVGSNPTKATILSLQENTMVNFDVTSSDRQLISKIAERAIKTVFYTSYTGLEVMMDVSAVHCNGNPLNLKELLKADDFNFAHDILGIYKHLNRETGKLENFFRPRYSEK